MKIFNNLFFVIAILFLAPILKSCKKIDSEYEKYLDYGQSIYPGPPVSLSFAPGNNRLLLYWKPSPDGSINKYRVYIDNNLDSITISNPSTNTADTIKSLVSSLTEGIHQFTVYSFDSLGNKSIPVSLSNARAYGQVYQSLLYNRGYDSIAYFTTRKILYVKWRVADTSNLFTRVYYTDALGVSRTQTIQPNSLSDSIKNYKPSTTITIRSYFKPTLNAIDTFATISATAPITPLNIAK